MKLGWVISVLLPLFALGQQNLVPNPSFENLTSCPTGSAQIHLADPWINDVGGCEVYNECVEPTFIPPDLYLPRQDVPENNVGFQFAHSGEGYAGIFTYGGQFETNGREYLQVPLTEPLQSGGYVVSFWASLADEFQYAVGSLGAYFSDTLVVRNNFNEVLNVEPSVQSPAGLIMSDKDIWYHITDTFASRYGGEQYLLIGNFKSTAESDTLLVPTGATGDFESYYYIDDVSVVAVDSTANGIGDMEDTVSHFGIYPNPNNGTMTIKYSLLEGEYCTVSIYSVLGELILKRQLSGASNQMELNLSNVNSGVYLLNLEVNGEQRLIERLSILKE